MTNYVDSRTIELMRKVGYKGDDKVTLKECEQFITQKNNNFVLNLDYNEQCDAWFFIVRNLKTGYIYKQPICPQQPVHQAYLWGLEHILNRL